MFKKSLLARAIALACEASALTLVISSAAYAQTSATGTVFGQVDSPAGASVLIENVDTGIRRTVTPGSDGRFQATSMPVGRYKVTLQRNGTAVTTRDDIEVSIGQGIEVSFAATTLKSVQVVGRRQTIDVSNVGSTTTFSASELSRLPVATNVGAVIQLAPGTTRGDSRYGGAGAPSFGGAGASENAYYINGFPVTTLLTQVGFSQLPFDSIAQAQILTGGYGAEFGRSTGGVVNIVTKSGGNDFVFGWRASLEPSGLRSTAKNQTFQNHGTTTANTNGKIRFFNEDNNQETTVESFYLGGPLIKDKLFFYFAGENTDVSRSESRLANSGTSTYTAAGAVNNCASGAGTFQNSSNCAAWLERDQKKERALLKLDWNITDQHHLEYTKIYDNVSDERRYYAFNYNTLQRGFTQNGGATYNNWGPTAVAAEQGSEVDILKYTGYLTNDLTLTALVGKTFSPHQTSPFNYNPALPQIVLTTPVPGLAYSQPQTATGNLLVPGASDKNKGARLDLEWKATSRHTLRAGLDYNKITSTAGNATAGGSTYTYTQTATPGMPTDRYSVAANSVAGNPLAQRGYYVFQSKVSTSTTPTVVQSAQYLEDRWQVTDRFLLSLGLRNESFDNRNGDDQSYIKLSKQLAPRLGAAWDVKGDASMKVFANAGRYHVPVPTNVAVRGAGASLNTTQNFAYTGVDPATGAPTGLTPLSPVFSNNNEFGQSKDPREVAAQDMKGNYQDELSFGIEQALAKYLTVGAKVTYRTLKSVIDDFCDVRPFQKWAAANGKDASKFEFNCALFNPGIANTFTIDVDGDGKLDTINLSAADLGYPKVKRRYLALDLFAEYPFDGKFYGRLNYTLSKNDGNTEGQLKSDIGQGDVATTQAFDFPEFSVGGDGLLPNDRRHQLKAFGYFQATPEWGFGGDLLVASGRPKNCIGNAPTNNPNVTSFSGYGSAYFFCNNVLTPRGSQGRLPPDIRLDVNVAYRPASIPGFMLKVDLFNAFNRQSIQTIEERYNAVGSSNVRTTYNAVESYAEPRYVKLSASYDYKF